MEENVIRNQKDTVFRMMFKEKIVNRKDIYKKKILPLPTPRFVVFYNGVDAQPERREYRLSDTFGNREFEKTGSELQLELVVLQLNINAGYNSELMKKCPVLFEYMCYVDKVREYQKLYPLEKAVRLAVEECIGAGILADFLRNK